MSARTPRAGIPRAEKHLRREYPIYPPFPPPK